MEYNAMFYSPLIECAMRTAAEAHAGQVRKGTSIPYFSHVAATALILARAGWTDETILAAAILHDCLEDTRLTREDIEKSFGRHVAGMVDDASEIKHDSDGEKLSWLERKETHLTRLEACSIESRAIVLADKIHNLGTLNDDLAAHPSVWDRFNATPEQTVWYYESVFDLAKNEPPLASFAEAAEPMLMRLRSFLADHSSAGSN